ncbi:MAG: NUDIX domain-containing protein [bacterium]|nr:NUDIX domain-containing protein [bacterium]
MDIDKSHHVIVNAVVEKDGKILVSQRSFEEAHEPGKWTIPGGKVDKTEGDVWNVLEATCAREVMEETGVEIQDNAELLTNNTFIHSSGKHAIALIFLCHWKTGEAQALEDTVGVKWISADGLDTLDFAPNIKTYIQRALEALQKS